MTPKKPYYNDIKFLNALFEQCCQGHQFRMDVNDMVSFASHSFDRIDDEIEFEEVFLLSGDENSVLYQNTLVFEFERLKPGTNIPELQYRLTVDSVGKEKDDGSGGVAAITYHKIFPVPASKERDTFPLVVNQEPFFGFVVSVLLDAVNGVLYNGEEGAYEDGEGHSFNLRSRLGIAKREPTGDGESTKGDASPESS